MNDCSRDCISQDVNKSSHNNWLQCFNLNIFLVIMIRNFIIILSQNALHEMNQLLNALLYTSLILVNLSTGNRQKMLEYIVIMNEIHE